MSRSISVNRGDTSFLRNSQIMREVGFLTLAAILLSGGIIWFYNRVLFNEQIYEIYSQSELAGITFMPYFISAAIAALTALYITYYIPTMMAKKQSHQIAERLQMLGQGDLASFARIQSSSEEINHISKELSYTVAQWNSHMSQMKIINRQQWDLIQAVKKAAVKNDSLSILMHLKEIEQNWNKIAEIEELIKT